VQPKKMMLAMLVAMTVAKPWQGIEPGVSTRDDIIEKFGKPTKTVTGDGQEVLAYQKGNQITGTKQAQFKVDSKTGVVQRIDVFPEPKLVLKQIEKKYGPECGAKGSDTKEKPCYLKRVEPQRMYVVYGKLGLAVFFSDDGTVASFAFMPGNK
jgi:hypothetical protein